jgi:hypothetical protein
MKIINIPRLALILLMESSVMENGFSIKQKKIMDIAKLALKINLKKTME